MKHARHDYDPIQDPRGLIPDNEPVFLLRAQDATAPGLVELWAIKVKELGAKENIVNAAKEQAIRMRDWQREHKMKIPDMPQ